MVKHTEQFAVFKNLGKAVRFLLAQKPARFYLQSQQQTRGENIEVENIKTGYTVIAKAQLLPELNGEEKSLIIFVIGSEDREKDLLQLSEEAFNSFDWE